MKIINKIQTIILNLLFFLTPLFFLPITTDFFSINKLYLLIFVINLLIFLTCINFLITKKISWQNNPLDKYLFLFLITITFSIIISSPNKIQALLNNNFDFITIFYLIIFYFYFSRLSYSINLLLNYSITILSFITIIFFFNPFKNVNLPNNLAFLKNNFFTPVGSQIDLAIILGFFIVYKLTEIIKQSKIWTNKKSFIIHYSLLIINLLALFLTLYKIFNALKQNLIILSPWRLSWYAAVEILKDPLTALFGVGIDNFSSIFTKVKDIAYNQSNLWQIPAFDYSISTLLHIMTETGILGLISFLMFIYQLVKTNIKDKYSLSIIIYSLLTIIFLPPTYILWFVFFLTLAILSIKDVINHLSKTKKTEINLSDFPPIYIGISIFILAFVGISSYLLGRNYLSEIYFKNSIDAISKNDLKSVYENQRQAAIQNPYLEKYYLNLSQTTLIIANNIVQNIQRNSTSEANIKEEDKQTLSQAIQQAISFAKDGAVKLNPQKASNWQNLGEIYKNIIGFAQQADVFAISSYQRAIVLDPQNPIYRLNLGGIYYILGKYDDAINLFTQAVSLKPEWPNSYYNLAWSYYQKQDYQNAVSSMNNVLKLLDKEKDKQDWEKANKELELFKNKLTEQEKQEKSTENNQSQLKLPTPQPTIEPKIKL